MKKQINSLEYSYGKTEHTMFVIPFLIMIIAAPLIAINLALLFADFVLQRMTLDYWTDLFGLSMSLAIVLTISHSAINQYNKIRVTKQGLEVRVFSMLVYRWTKVPWSEVFIVKPSEREDRWGKTLWIIEVKKLTIWHRFISMVFFTGKHPVILISSDMEQRDLLLNSIKEYIKTS